MKIEDLKTVIPLWDTEYIGHNLEEIDAINRKLMAAMMQHEGMQGITAKQIGIPAPMAVFQKRSGEFEFMINPEILKSHGRQEGFYVCSSFPGFIGKVSRAPKIKVKYINAQSLMRKQVSLRADESFIFQYLTDLIQGIVLFDKAMTEVHWKKYKKLYRVESSTFGYNYYLEGEYKLLFGGIDVGQTAGGEVVGVSLNHPAEDKPIIDAPERMVIL
jgi:peptide deformylase